MDRMDDAPILCLLFIGTMLNNNGPFLNNGLKHNT